MGRLTSKMPEHQYTTETAGDIGQKIEPIGMPPGNEGLMQFVTRPVKGGGKNAQSDENYLVFLYSKGAVSPVKQDTQAGIGQKV